MNGLDIKETDKPYYILTNPKELTEKLREKGFTNAVCIEGVDIGDNGIEFLKMQDKTVVILVYCDYGDAVTLDDFIGKLEESGLVERTYKSTDDCVNSIDEWVDLFDGPEKFEEHLEFMGYIKTCDYDGLCGNFHSELDPTDKYCRKCGTRRGEGRFEPYFNSRGIYYGSPIIYNLPANI